LVEAFSGVDLSHLRSLVRPRTTEKQRTHDWAAMFRIRDVLKNFLALRRPSPRREPLTPP
jgi:hypothetical protein